MGTGQIGIIAIIISLTLVTLPAFGQTEYLEVKPSNIGTLDIGIALIPENPTPPEEVRFQIDFINPKTDKIQEHIDYRFTLQREGENVFGPTSLIHTSEGTVKIPVEIIESGTYFALVEYEGILFQPIPVERASFTIPIADSQESVATPVAEDQSNWKYHNELYEFSFDVPSDWVYWENVLLGDGVTTYQVMLTREDFSFYELEKRGYQAGLLDSFTGLPFPLGTPNIGVIFENVAQSKIPQMNAQEIEKYEREIVATNLPSAKISKLNVETKPWGWIAVTRVSYGIDSLQLTEESHTFYFEDRESYSVAFSSHTDRFDEWYYVFDDALEKLEIRGIKVNQPPYTLADQIQDEVQQKVSEAQNTVTDSGGCLIATATYGSELAPQVQQLRKLRDNSLLQTESGSTFMTGFNQLYYSFSPTIADWERENPAFKETVKIAITPLISSLSILNLVDLNSESEVLGYGIGIIVLNIGMYIIAPSTIIWKLRKK